MLVDEHRDGGTFSEEEKLAANEQLERLLANPYFSHSRRFPSFLRFIVSQTLSGRTDLLKERTVGIEVFGKSANYDTANDPIVRVTAAEIRKRIAQYYQDPAHEHELRLSLAAGVVCAEVRSTAQLSCGRAALDAAHAWGAGERAGWNHRIIE